MIFTILLLFHLRSFNCNNSKISTIKVGKLMCVKMYFRSLASLLTLMLMVVSVIMSLFIFNNV